MKSANAETYEATFEWKETKHWDTFLSSNTIYTTIHLTTAHQAGLRVLY
jgi:hypothetical protein